MWYHTGVKNKDSGVRPSGSTLAPLLTISVTLGHSTFKAQLETYRESFHGVIMRIECANFSNAVNRVWLTARI